jgi:predicted branched-subunit amino acid permease
MSSNPEFINLWHILLTFDLYLWVSKSHILSVYRKLYFCDESFSNFNRDYDRYSTAANVTFSFICVFMTTSYVLWVASMLCLLLSFFTFKLGSLKFPSN